VQNFPLLFSEKNSIFCIFCEFFPCFGGKTKRKFLVEKLKEITDTPPLFFPKFRGRGGTCGVTP